MAKFYGVIGYSETKETKPDVWEECITERKYFCDILQFTKQVGSSGNVNDNININSKISVIADSFAYENIGSMRYVEWMGVKWKITSIEPLYPRLILILGGVYNE